MVFCATYIRERPTELRLVCMVDMVGHLFEEVFCITDKFCHHTHIIALFLLFNVQ